MFVTNLIFTLETTENDAWMPTLALGKLLNTFSREVGFGCFMKAAKASELRSQSRDSRLASLSSALMSFLSKSSK